MNNRLVKLLALVLALMLVMSGCSMIEVDKEKDNAQTAAVVGGEVITKGEAQSLYDYYVDYYTYLYSICLLYTSKPEAAAAVDARLFQAEVHRV